MTEETLTVTSNEKIARDTFRTGLSGDCTGIERAGQFINIKLDGFFLRRPISVCDYTPDSVRIIYKTGGGGTETMRRLTPGTRLSVLMGLGNGYNTLFSGCRPLLIGGGVGVPPLYNLCKTLIAEGQKPAVILGFNSSDDMFYEDEFKFMTPDVFITTADGSYGIKGFVTDALVAAGEYTYVYTCGPEAMLRSVYDKTSTPGQYSFEERMGCGFGACMGCTCKTKYGAKRICKDGPVLTREEIIW